MNLSKILICSLGFLSAPVLYGQAAEPAEKPAEAEAVTVVKAEKLMDVLKADPKIVIVDIRTPAEFEEGHLPKATNINFMSDEFTEELGKLDRDKTYLMHCKSGGRSTASLEIWKKLGFKKILHLDTGIVGAEKAGVKLVKEEKK